LPQSWIQRENLRIRDGQEDYDNYHRPHGALDGQTPATLNDESSSVTDLLGIYSCPS